MYSLITMCCLLPGVCYRLFTEDSYENILQDVSIPEIQRVNISQIILQLKAIGNMCARVCIFFVYVYVYVYVYFCMIDYVCGLL